MRATVNPAQDGLQGILNKIGVLERIVSEWKRLTQHSAIDVKSVLEDVVQASIRFQKTGCIRESEGWTPRLRDLRKWQDLPHTISEVDKQKFIKEVSASIAGLRAEIETLIRKYQRQDP